MNSMLRERQRTLKLILRPFHRVNSIVQSTRELKLCIITSSASIEENLSLRRRKHVLTYSSINNGPTKIERCSKLCFLAKSNYSTGNVMPNGEKEPIEETASPSLYKRFKMAYKQHGKTLMAVHVATSIVWYGGFFYAVQSGVDIVTWLEQLGASDTILKPFKIAGLGDFAVAYLMYKLATPARYTVTLGGTNIAIKYLKKSGYIKEVSQEDKLRSLMQESKVKFKEKRDDWKDKIRTHDQ